MNVEDATYGTLKQCHWWNSSIH